MYRFPASMMCAIGLCLGGAGLGFASGDENTGAKVPSLMVLPAEPAVVNAGAARSVEVDSVVTTAVVNVSVDSGYSSRGSLSDLNLDVDESHAQVPVPTPRPVVTPRRSTIKVRAEEEQKPAPRKKTSRTERKRDSYQARVAKLTSPLSPIIGAFR